MRTASLALIVIFAAAAQTAHAQKIKAVRDAGSANILKVRVARDLPDGELSEAVVSSLAENPDKVRQAFTYCVPSGSVEIASCVQRVFVTDLGTDETYEIIGEELFIEANRPVDSLRWLSDDVLSYERWAGPHFGHRYIVDIKRKKQIGAYVLSDR